MYEHAGIAAVLLILAVAGNLGRTEPPCCKPMANLAVPALASGDSQAVEELARRP